MAQISVLDAPSNLGLRPSLEGSVPGCYKAPWALREAGILHGLDVVDEGVVIPPRYEAAWSPGDGDRNAVGMARYSRDLADRLEALLRDRFVLVLGGDCSILIGEALAMRRHGRHGIAFIDGHGDFRHQGNDELVAAAGEDLAIVTGRGDPRLVDLDGLGPLVREQDVVAIGIRPTDAFLAELDELGIATWPIDRLAAHGVPAAVADTIARLDRPILDGFWVHLDVDVLDASIMPAVDSPEPGGLSFEELGVLLGGLLAHPAAIGLDVCIFDPDLDPTGKHADALAATIHEALASR